MIAPFREAFERRHERAKQENAQGRRIVGWVCTYVPEELLHAASLLPARVVGAGRETPQADAHLYTNLCTFARSALEEGFGGHYDYLDGLVTCNTCDSIRRLYDAWSIYLPTPFTHLLSLPHKFTESAVLYFRQQLAGLKGAMEEQFGVEISEEALRRSIALYNRTRSLLRQIYDLRRADAPPLTGAEALEVVLAGMVLPKEEYNAMLEELLRELSARPPAHHDSKARLLVTGSELDSREYLELIEGVGGLVVSDDLCTGSRYFWDPVDEEGDPLTALAHRYLLRAPCARMRPSTRRIEHLKALAERYRAEGIILEGLKFCDLYGGDYLLVKRGLEGTGLPLLRLEREYVRGGGAGQVKTRVQAFLEQLTLIS